MIDFKEVELNDKRWMDTLIKAGNMGGCHQNFTNIFAWSETFNYRVAQFNNYLVVKGSVNGEDYYFYPTGTGDIMPVIEEMKQDAIENGHNLIILGASPENIGEMKKEFPESYEYKPMRDSFDYVYLLDKLVSLSGNKYHSKRNHVNRFKVNNPNWSFELITEENITECWDMNVLWCRANEFYSDDQLINETCAVSHCFNNYFELGLEGGLLRVDGKVIAFTMGEQLNSNTYVIHIEKALNEIRGAYQMINREFAEYIQSKYPQINYVNREEDMGYEGLRKAKLSYNPIKMEEKYAAKYLGE